MFGVNQKSTLVRRNSKQQNINRNGPWKAKQNTGPVTRKRSREMMQAIDLLQLSTPIPQKKGSPFKLPFKVLTVE